MPRHTARHAPCARAPAAGVLPVAELAVRGRRPPGHYRVIIGSNDGAGLTAAHGADDKAAGNEALVRSSTTFPWTASSPLPPLTPEDHSTASATCWPRRTSW